MDILNRYKKFISIGMIMILLTTVVLTDNRKAMASSFVANAANYTYEIVSVLLGLASGHKLSEIVTKDNSKKLDVENNGDGTYTVNVSSLPNNPIYLNMSEAEYFKRYAPDTYSLSKTFNQKIQGCMTYDEWRQSMIRENAGDVPYGPLTWSDYKTAFDKMYDNNKDNLLVTDNGIIKNNLKSFLNINTWNPLYHSTTNLENFMGFINTSNKSYVLFYDTVNNSFYNIQAFDSCTYEEFTDFYSIKFINLYEYYILNNGSKYFKFNEYQNYSFYKDREYLLLTNNTILKNINMFSDLPYDLDSHFKGQTIDFSNNNTITYDNFLKPDAIALPEGITDVNALVNTLGVTDGDLSNANIKDLIESILGQQTITTTSDIPIGGDIDEEWYRNIQSLLERISSNVGAISNTDTSGAISGKIDELIDSNALTRTGVIDAVNDVVQELVNSGVITLEDVQGVIAEERDRADAKELDFVTDLDTKLTIDNWTLGSAIVNKFPFCVPFDLIKLVKLLSADPVAPRYEFNFKFKGLSQQKIVLDMKDFESVAKVSRWFFLILFVGMLTVGTRNMIKG